MGVRDHTGKLPSIVLVLAFFAVVHAMLERMSTALGFGESIASAEPVAYLSDNENPGDYLIHWWLLQTGGWAGVVVNAD